MNTSPNKETEMQTEAQIELARLKKALAEWKRDPKSENDGLRPTLTQILESKIAKLEAN